MAPITMRGQSRKAGIDQTEAPEHAASRCYRATRWVLRQLGFAYFRLRVSGLQHLPASGPAILAGNHPNVLDGILLMIVSPRPVRFLVAEEMYLHRYLHRFFRAFGCIPVYRMRTANGDALHEAIAALTRGEVLGIFPEGTTSNVGRMRQVKQGVGLLALRTGAPVVPFGIEGSAAAYPQGTRVPRPRRICLAFATPVRYAVTLSDPIPGEHLTRVLEGVRWEILRAMRWAMAAFRARQPAWWLKPAQVLLSGCVVLPLAGFLSVTSHQSLDPAAGEHG